MARLELTLLGGFHASVDGSEATGFDTDKTRALLIYLSVESSRAHTRETLFGLLWPELPEEAARRNLRNSLFRLRQALGEEEASSSLLLITPQTVQLDPTGDWRLDSADFTGLIAASRTHRHRKPLHCSSCHDRLQRAAELYHGDFLKGFHLANCQEFEEWLVLQREALHREALDVLGRLSAYYDARAEYEQALLYSHRQLEFESWREEAHREAMRLLAVTGQRSAALAQYESCRQALALELAAEPSAETKALYELLKAGNLEADQVPSSRSKHNLPRQLAPFIGRREELERITEQLDSPDYSLITLVGPGGVGKTRLALQAASDQLGAFDDGVYFVSLASISAPQLLGSGIAQAIGFRQPSGAPDVTEASGNGQAQLVNYLRDKEMLLVLDNFEQLLGTGGIEATGLLLSILRGAPRIRMLVTSRERLGLQHESLLDLSGLPLPEVLVGTVPVEMPGSESVPDPAELMLYSAVQLFVERAQQAHPHFSLSHDTAKGVVDICRLVAGLPLGIVLAAPWVRHLSPARIADSIGASLDFLTSSARDASPQHASLRAVFNHSWNLLSEEEQRVLRNLSIFRGGWVEEAAERVVGASLHSLVSLVDKSLLRRDASGRFDIHEVLRQYAGEKLDEVAARAAFPASARAGFPQRSGREQDEVESRHAEYYLLLAEEAEKGLTTGEQGKWLQRLDEEHDNLRAVLRWAGVKGEVEVGLRMGGALWRFWTMHGHFGEGKAHLAAMLSLSPRSEGPESKSASETRDFGTGTMDFYRAKALFGAGALHMAQGDLDTARTLYEQSLALSRELGDRQGMAAALNTLGIVAHYQGDYDAARALYEESLVFRRELGDTWGIASMLNNLGIMAHYQGDYDAASTLHEESLALRRELEDRRGIASSLENLGHAAHNRGDYYKALALYEESLALTRELGDKWGTALLLFRLGNVAQNKEEYDSARALHDESLGLRREIGDKQGIASSLNSLGIIAYQHGDYDAARVLYEESLALRRELGEKWAIATTLNSLGLVALHRAEDEGALAALEESLALRRELGDRRGIASSLAGLGELFLRKAVRERQEEAKEGSKEDGEEERAVRLFGAVEVLLEGMGCVLDIEVRQAYERSTTEARALLGSTAFERAFAEGKGLSLDQAINYALEGRVPPG